MLNNLCTIHTQGEKQACKNIFEQQLLSDNACHTNLFVLLLEFEHLLLKIRLLAFQSLTTSMYKCNRQVSVHRQHGPLRHGGIIYLGYSFFLSYLVIQGGDLAD